MALADLNAIRTKVRRLTRNPDEDQLTTAQLDDYINTFVLYDFPEQLRLFNLRSTLTFYTQPNVAVYDTNTTDPNAPLYDFKNRYITIHPPVYIAGIQIRLSQSREELFNYYPQNQFILGVATGDGVTTSFSGTLSAFPVAQNQVTFTSIDANNNGLVLIDYPVSNELGALGVPNVSQTIPSPYGQINYVTGAYTVNFGAPYAAPAQGQTIFAQTFPYVASIPTVVMFYDGQFTFRPIPDKSYRVTMDAWIQPTSFLTAAQVPELSEWWQYISYGAAKKVFEDKMDLDSVQLIMPEFKQQERLILRRTLVQQSNERSATIYQAGNSLMGAPGFFYGGTF